MFGNVGTCYCILSSWLRSGPLPAIEAFIPHRTTAIGDYLVPLRFEEPNRLGLVPPFETRSLPQFNRCRVHVGRAFHGSQSGRQMFAMVPERGDTVVTQRKWPLASTSANPLI